MIKVSVYDYMDRDIPVLQRMYKRRLKAYKEVAQVKLLALGVLILEIRRDE